MSTRLNKCALFRQVSLLSLLVVSGAAYALTDDALLDRGIFSYNERNYIEAVMHLFAYRERDPALLRNNSQFRSDFNAALDYSRQQLIEQREEVARLREQLRRERDDGIGSRTSGITRTRPQLSRPPASPLGQGIGQVAIIEGRFAIAENVRESDCTKPNAPVLRFPRVGQTQSNHYYGRGEPWRFEWGPSACGQTQITQYHIVVRMTGRSNPAVDTIVSEPRYVGDTTGTLVAGQWTFKVQAIDSQNQLSDWSEERLFRVGEWIE